MSSDYLFVQRVINGKEWGNFFHAYSSLYFMLFIFIFWVNLMGKLVISQYKWRNGHFQNQIKFGGQKIKHLKLVVVTHPCRAGLDHLEHWQ